MKSYWVSTSQKMTRAMAMNLSDYTGACQQEGGQAKSLPALEFEGYRNLITARVARAPHAVRPHLEREVLTFGGCEADLQKERRFPGQSEHLGEALCARLGDQRSQQRAAHACPLPILAHGERSQLGQIARVHLERSAPDELARRPLRDDVLLDVPAEIVVRARQQIAGCDVGRHQELELRDVGKHRTPHDRPREGAGSGEQGALLPVNRQRAHARISSRIATPRSSSSTVITSGGSRRTTCGPAVTTSRPCSRAAATIGSAGFNAAATALVTSTAPMGRPPASGFARVRMSGTTPACS